jgi:integrase
LPPFTGKGHRTSVGVDPVVVRVRLGGDGSRRPTGLRGAFHTLRHGAATLMLAGRVPDAVAIKIMGHADTKILRRYQEVVDELQRDAATRMDGLLGGGL